VNISAVLEKAWNDVSKAGLAGHTLNESVIGFQLCQTIREQHPELNLSLDCRRADDECEQVGTPQISDRGHVSTLVISTPGDDARVLFIGKLMPSGPAVLHASQVIAELREDFKRKETSVLTRDAHSGGYTGQQVPLSQTCAFGLFVLPGDDPPNTTGSAPVFSQGNN
jgi:hypothetical protein